MGLDEFLDAGFELRDAAVGAAPDLFHGQLGKPALDEAEPRAVRGGEVHVESGPFLDRLARGGGLLPVIGRENAHNLLGIVTVVHFLRFMRTRELTLLSGHSDPMDEHTRHFYDRISRAYDLLADSSEHAVRHTGVQALGLSLGQRALEIGSGTGHGLVSLAGAVGPTGQVCGVDLSGGMTAVASSCIVSAGLKNVSLCQGDARALCFQSHVFDAVFMSFTLELFESAITAVLAEVRRVLSASGRVSVVAMAETSETNAMMDLYKWLHRHWPHVVDCRPIDVVSLLEAAGFQTRTVAATRIWDLPVVTVTGVTRRG